MVQGEKTGVLSRLLNKCRQVTLRVFGGREEEGMPESLKWEERVFAEAGSTLETARGS